MTATPDIAELTRRHYGAGDLVAHLRGALGAYGPEETVLIPAQLAPLDQFHTRGIAATAELAALAGIGASDRVLDAGSGIGGPARFLAATLGCRVTGLDLSPDFTEAARYLAGRTGLAERVRFETGDVTRMGFADASFDVALLQHVAMNVADRPALYRALRRVLVQGGRFATYDIVRLQGAPDYPLPWARDPAASTVLTTDETLAAVGAAGFRTQAAQDDTAAAIAFFAGLAGAAPGPAPAAAAESEPQSGPEPRRGPGLALIMGPDFPVLAGNLGRALADGRLGVLAAVFEAA